MKLFNTILLIGIFTVTAEATTLKSMIDSTLENNQNLQSLDTINQSKQKSYDSVQNIYNPTLNIGANYSKLSGDVRNVQVEDTITGYAKLSVNLYDGGKNHAVKKQKEYEYKSSLLSTQNTKKEVLLQVVTLYFQAKTIIENIKVLEEKSNTLKAQYDRMQEKYDLEMITQDEVLKLKSEYETNQYAIEELKYNKIQLLQNLSLLCGQNITTIDNSTLPEIDGFNYQPSTLIKSLDMNLKAQDENIKLISSSNKVQVKLDDTQNVYNYNNYNDKLLYDLPDQQNQLMLSVSFKLFDTTTSGKLESAKLAKLASKQKLNYQKEYEKIQFDLATRKVHTQKQKIISLKSAVEMGNSVYEMVKVKYQNGIVDNITYLDALSKKIYNLALYAQALNDYEIAKANYYFSSGIDYNEILEKF